MRKISPVKAVSHALNSVITYRAMAFRIGKFWVPVLVVAGLLESLVGPPDPQDVETGPVALQLATAALGFIAFCSMAVNWHRFILRDDTAEPARLDAVVWRYAGNSLLIMLIVLAPLLVMAYLIVLLHPAATVIFVAAGLGAGAVVTGLSIKLPAVALGRTDFTFGNAWAACQGNFWQLMGIFLLNAAVFFAAVLVMIVIVSALASISAIAALLAQIAMGAALQLFYTLFNASIFTSLYGFFVEQRDF